MACFYKQAPIKKMFISNTLYLQPRPKKFKSFKQNVAERGHKWILFDKITKSNHSEILFITFYSKNTCISPLWRLIDSFSNQSRYEKCQKETRFSPQRKARQGHFPRLQTGEAEPEDRTSGRADRPSRPDRA